MNILTRVIIALALIMPIALWADATTHRDIGPVGPEDGRGDYLADVQMLPVKPGNSAIAVNLHRRAMIEYRAKRYAPAEDLWLQAAKADPSWAKPIFNLACAAALQGKNELAVKFLEEALKRHPFVVMAWMKTDSDLVSVRKTAFYTRLVKDYPWELTAGNPDIAGRVGLWEAVFPNGYAVLHFDAIKASYRLIILEQFDSPRGDDSLEAKGTYSVAGWYIFLKEDSVNGAGDMKQKAAMIKKLRIGGKTLVKKKDLDGSPLVYEAPSLIVEGPGGKPFLVFYGAGFLAESALDAM